MNLLSSVPDRVPTVIDGLAYGVMEREAALLSSQRPIISLVHHPLARETGLSAKDATAFHDTERAALAHAHRVITTSGTTSDILAADFGVPPNRMTVIRPGNDRHVVPTRALGRTVRLLSVGSITPRKGFDILVAALATLADLPWHLTIVGDRSRDPVAASQLDDDITRRGLLHRIDVTGAVPEADLAGLYREADVFVLASRFEGYGMAFAEAIGYGLPVVGTQAGAISEAVPHSAGILAPPDDVTAFAVALRSLIVDPGRRSTLAAGALRHASDRPTWTHAAALFADAIDKTS
jgi:glycosyltransferase involved in cell wall biosynthesis